MDVKLKLSNAEHKDLVDYCNLNDLLISSVVKDSFTAGYNIEKYGLLNTDQEVKEVEVIKEVTKYIEVERPVEVIKEVIIEKTVEVIKEVPVERIVEVIKEIPVEKVVIQEVIREVPVEVVVKKTEYISDNTQINELLLKIQQLEDTPPRIVEVIKEVPVDRVVIQEKPVEVIIEKEVIREVEKTVVDNSKSQMLQETLQKIRGEGIEKDKRIKELEKQIDDIKQMDVQRGAVYLRGSNLNDTLYK